MMIITGEAILLWFLIYIFMEIYSKDFLGFRMQNNKAFIIALEA